MQISPAKFYNPVSSANKPAFKAHYYDVKVIGGHSPYIRTIKIDDNPSLGAEPELIITAGSGYEDYRLIPLEKAKPLPMYKSGGFYTTKPHNFIKEYKIHYKDTDKYDDNNGQNYCFDVDYKDKLANKAVLNLKVINNQLLAMTVAKGTVFGKIVFVDNLDELKTDKSFDKNTPTILCFRKNEIEKTETNTYTLPKNITGVVQVRGNIRDLSHSMSRFRNVFNAVHITLDPNEIEKLRALEGKYMKMTCQNNTLSFQEIDDNDINNEIKPEKTTPKIEITPMKGVDTLINLQDYEVDTVGPKAYKLKIMENLADSGKLKDVIIPKSFAVTHGFIDKMCEYEKTAFNQQEIYGIDDENLYLKQIREFAEQNNIQGGIMVRSSFNGEDTEGYSAAGLYTSVPANIKFRGVGDNILRVVASKNSLKAKKSRKINNIPEDIIKPTVIIQEKIDSDYNFTIYTKDNNEDGDVLTINLNENLERNGIYMDNQEPYILKFNKKTNKLKITSKTSAEALITFDREGNIADTKLCEDKLTTQWHTIKPLLKKVIKNALVLEKELNGPQDIEGGIKDGQIYFWQTRNIVR